MKPAPFEYHGPRSLEETIALLGRYGSDAKLLAGGQSLVPMMNMRLARPAVLIDLGHISGLDYVKESDGHVAIGALTRQRAAEQSTTVARLAPLLAQALPWIGHPTIRNRGTIGGSLAHADPAAELPAAAVALDATLTIAGPSGRRRIPAREFFRGPLTTVLEPREILVEIAIPGPAATAWGFAELARRAGDFALAGAAGVLWPAPGERARCAGARLVAFGCGDTPMRLPEAESLLAGALIDPALARAAGAAAAAATTPGDDVHASAEYRRHLVGVLTEQVVLDAAARLRA